MMLYINNYCNNCNVGHYNILLWRNFIVRNFDKHTLNKIAYTTLIKLGAARAECFISWLAEQEDRGSIPGLATWIFRLVISCFQVRLKYRWSDVNPQYNQPINISNSYIFEIHFFLAHLSRRLEWAIVIAHRPSSVVVVCKLSHFRLLLQNRSMDFDETW